MSNHASLIRSENIGKTVTARGRHFIEFDNGDGSRKFVATIDPLHYGTNQDQEIDTGWVVDTGAWQWRNILNDHLIHARDVFNVGSLFEWRLGDEWVIFDPQSINFVNQDYSRQQIAIKQAITGQVDDDIMNFPNAYKPGVHYSLFAHPKRLVKHITIDNFSDLPEPETWLTGTIHFEAEFTLENSAGVELFLDGVEWDRNNKVITQTYNRIEFRDINGIAQWYADTPFAIDANGETIPAQYEVEANGGVYFIRVRVPYEWLETAVYPVIIDPTLDTYAPNFDTFIDSGSESNQSSSVTINVRENVVGTYRHGIFDFDLSTLDGATINTATLTLTNSQNNTFNADIAIHRITRSCTSAATWNTYDGSNSWTSAGGDYDGTALDTVTDINEGTGETNVFDLATAIQDIADGTYTNYGWLVLLTSDASEYKVHSAEATTESNRPHLEVDYETGITIIMDAA